MKIEETIRVCVDFNNEDEMHLFERAFEEKFNETCETWRIEYKREITHFAECFIRQGQLEELKDLVNKLNKA